MAVDDGTALVQGMYAHIQEIVDEPDQQTKPQVIVSSREVSKKKKQVRYVARPIPAIGTAVIVLGKPEGQRMTVDELSASVFCWLYPSTRLSSLLTEF